MQWDVLHKELCQEVITTYNTTTSTSQVRTDKICFSPTPWKEKLHAGLFLSAHATQQKKDQPKLHKIDFFPSIGTNQPADHTLLQISNCRFEGSHTPLTLLQTFFQVKAKQTDCISYGFAKCIFAALNGIEQDWPLMLMENLKLELTMLQTTLHTDVPQTGGLL